MALSTYDELRDSMARWLNREDLEGDIPDYIALLEADVNRELRVREMIMRAVTIPAADEPRENLPGDFLELKAIQFNTDPVTVPQYATPAWIRAYRRKSSTLSGAPQFYTIEGSQFLFDRTPSGVELEIMYYQRISPLATTDTNWLLSAHPDIYLYGSLLHSAPFLKDDERVAVWDTLYKRGLDKLMVQNNRGEANSAPVVIRVRPGRSIG